MYFVLIVSCFGNYKLCNHHYKLLFTLVSQGILNDLNPMYKTRSSFEVYDLYLCVSLFLFYIIVCYIFYSSCDVTVWYRLLIQILLKDLILTRHHNKSQQNSQTNVLLNNRVWTIGTIPIRFRYDQKIKAKWINLEVHTVMYSWSTDYYH